ncbi:MAG: class I SAM-dependent methyltransferase [Bryobacterales bacterium]|nr:class I SAM-dependent methyltransferase [Bryobacterales bacterium]
MAVSTSDPSMVARTGLLTCVFCGFEAYRFCSYGLDTAVFAEKHVVGGGRRPNGLCPGCGSVDRERLVFLFLVRCTRVFHQSGLALLHVAPEPLLGCALRCFVGRGYRAIDLQPSPGVEAMDLTALQMSETSIDVAICNHVFEHIEEDRLAMRELFRILRPGGWAVVQVPIAYGMRCTYEDRSIRSPEARTVAFGQHDHVRIYGLDYFERLRSVEFDVRVLEPARLFGNDAIESFALLPNEKLIVVQKRKAP